MLKIALGAEFNSEKMFKDVAALSRKYKGVQLHTHVAENPVSTSAAALHISDAHHLCSPHSVNSCAAKMLFIELMYVVLLDFCLTVVPHHGKQFRYQGFRKEQAPGTQGFRSACQIQSLNGSPIRL